MKAIERLRQFLTLHYCWIKREKNEADRKMLKKAYGAKRWQEASLKELCQQLHQIIYDEGHNGVIAVAKFFVVSSHDEGSVELFTVFESTEEHSH